MATIHIMHGYIAFGKTTLARRLANELPAVVLNADDWIKQLYGTTLSESEFMARADTVLNMQWELTRQIINAGADVILDIGPWSRDMRKQAYAMARQITPNIIFHTIILDMETARNRLIQRNIDNPGHDVTDTDFFDANRDQYEPITPDEGYTVRQHYPTENP